jgi:hypothetical protein
LGRQQREHREEDEDPEPRQSDGVPK